MKKTTAEIVRDMIATILVIEPDEVSPDAAIVEDLGADSLDLLEFSLCFEQEFGVEVSDAEVEGWRTVSDAIEAAEKAAGKA